MQPQIEALFCVNCFVTTCLLCLECSLFSYLIRICLFFSSFPRSEIWLGQSNEAICVWNAECRTTDYYLNHGSKVVKSSSSCAFLITSSGTTDCKYVWSYNYPGEFGNRLNKVVIFFQNVAVFTGIFFALLKLKIFYSLYGVYIFFCL